MQKQQKTRAQIEKDWKYHKYGLMMQADHETITYTQHEKWCQHDQQCQMQPTNRTVSAVTVKYDKYTYLKDPSILKGIRKINRNNLYFNSYY